MYDEEDAKQLLSDCNIAFSNVSEINVNNCINSFGSNVCDTTKANSGINDTNIGDYLGNLNSIIIPTLDSTITNLDFTIQLIADLDGQVDIETLDALSGIIKLSDLSSYRYDIVYNDEGMNYILFTQTGHKGEDSSLLHQFKYFLTDGQGGPKGTSLAGASCSMCSCSNAISNLIGLPAFLEGMGIDDKFISSDSLNASMVVAFNYALYDYFKEKYPNEKTIDIENNNSSENLGKSKETLFEIMAEKFKDKVDYTAYNCTSSTVPEEVLENVKNGKATMVVRLGQNNSSNARYRTNWGHFVEVNGYKVDENGQKMVYVLDSAVSYEDNRNNANDASKRRTGWVPYEDVFGHLRPGSENNMFVYTAK